MTSGYSKFQILTAQFKYGFPLPPLRLGRAGARGWAEEDPSPQLFRTSPTTSEEELTLTETALTRRGTGAFPGGAVA